MQKRANHIPLYVGKRKFLIPDEDSAYDNVDVDSLKSYLHFVLNNPDVDLSELFFESEPSNKEASLSQTEETVEKRRQPLFVGRRRAPLFIGKRQPIPSSLVVGKRRVPSFVGRRGAAPIFVGKRRAPLFLGRRGAPLLVGRRSEEDIDSLVYGGERSVLASDDNLVYDNDEHVRNLDMTPVVNSLDKKAWGRYIPWNEMDNHVNPQSPSYIKIGKRFTTPEFVGKRNQPFLDLAELENLHSFQTDRTNPTIGQLSKRFETPMFIGRRSFDSSNSYQNFETLNTDDLNQENEIFDEIQNSPTWRSVNFNSNMDTVK